MATARSRAREAFTERFDWDGEKGSLAGSDASEGYWQDTISELADGMVPVYSIERVQVWLGEGLPDVDDPGLIEGVTDVTQIIGAALYEHYLGYLYELADESGLSD